MPGTVTLLMPPTSVTSRFTGSQIVVPGVSRAEELHGNDVAGVESSQSRSAGREASATEAGRRAVESVLAADGRTVSADQLVGLVILARDRGRQHGNVGTTVDADAHEAAVPADAARVAAVGDFMPEEARNVEWLAAQPCPAARSAGMLGSSYLGGIQVLTAGQRPKGLAAVAPTLNHRDSSKYWPAWNSSISRARRPGTCACWRSWEKSSSHRATA